MQRARRYQEVRKGNDTDVICQVLTGQTAGQTHWAKGSESLSPDRKESAVISDVVDGLRRWLGFVRKADGFRSRMHIRKLAHYVDLKKENLYGRLLG